MSRLRSAAVVLSLLFAATSFLFLTATVMSPKALAADQPKASAAPKAIPQPSGQKLIALTFDDGPRPYVLYGKTPGEHGLLDLLDHDNVKATFFYMGWRLTPKTWGERHETNIGKTCLDAAADVYKRGHELENHTYSHLDAKHAQKQYGEDWYVQDVEKGAKAVEQITGSKPHYVRPPEWVMWPELRSKLEGRGYKVLTIYASDPALMRDVNSGDYLCAGKATQCPKPSLAESVMHQIESREKHGLYDHVLVFHELTSTIPQLETLIPELQKKGYKFVTLQQYMKTVASSQ